MKLFTSYFRKTLSAAFAFVALWLISTTANAQTTIGASPYTVPSTGTYTIPPNVISLTVQCWGGGGGGGGCTSNSNNASGGGGGGGAFSVVNAFSVTPGTSITITVGAGGTSGSGTAAGHAGATSQVVYNSSTVISAAGGAGGGGGNNGTCSGVNGGGGGAGGAGGSTGTGLAFAGGFGGDSNANAYNDGGGGGAAGGTTGVGGVGSPGSSTSCFAPRTTHSLGHAGGIAAAGGGGGNGGAGGNNPSFGCNGGAPGSSPGGGGGAAGGYGTPCSGTGGAGANGAIIITYTLCTPPTGGGVISGPSQLCSGATNVTYSISGETGTVTSYTWTFPSGVTLLNTNGTTSTTMTVNWGSTFGNVTCVPANSSGACQDLTVLAYTVSIIPTPSQPSVITVPSPICQGTPQPYSVTAAADHYNWSNTPGGWTGSSTTNSINLTANSSSTVVTVTPYNVCNVAGPSRSTSSVAPNLPVPLTPSPIVHN